MKKLGLPILFAAAIALNSCETLENLCGISAEDLGFTEDYTKQLNAAIYIYQQGDLALRDSTLKATGNAIIDGAMCTRTADSIIVNYGNGTICRDGKVRKGKFRIGYSGDYILPGSTANLVLTNYFEGDLDFSGALEFENTTSSAEPAFAITVVDLKQGDLTLAGPISALWTSGFTTEEPTDDIFQLGGSLGLTDAVSTDVFTGTINNPLVIAYDCEYSFVGGNISLTSTNADLPAVNIDFIPGDCANLFTAQIDCQGNPIQFSYPIK